MIRELAVSVLALAVAACGDDPQPKHTLKREALESNPTGDAVEVVYGAKDGETFAARINLSMQYRQESSGGQSRVDKGEGRAVMEVRQTFRRPGSGPAPRSEVTFRYVEAEGVNAEAYLERETIKGTLEHDADGRAKARTLKLEGGTKAEQVEVRDVLCALMLAGFAGSPSWMPPRGVRVGEAWQLEAFIQPVAMENIALQAKKVGLQVPKPTFAGTARLEQIREGGFLEVSIDALLELHGPIRRGGREGSISIGDRVRGRAVISPTTGLPVSFKVIHTGEKRIRSGEQKVDQTFTSELEGRIERSDDG